MLLCTSGTTPRLRPSGIVVPSLTLNPAHAIMRILVIGGTGTIGNAIVQTLGHDHETVVAGRTHGPVPVDLASPDSVRELFRRSGRLDAIVCAAGQAKFAPLADLADVDFAFSLANKLMGQVNVVRFGMETVRDGGSITLTSGVLATQPTPGSAAISLVNAAVEGFVRAAALEAPRGIRVNVVSPPWVSETLTAMGRDPAGGAPAATVARAYVNCVTGSETGAVIAVGI
jgi:NAD(P)-dependent dehydrogenase (short-subunit alcohol dehydrogenase family)